jgi:hypothetical protein
MKVCPKCYEDNPADSKVCRQCGSPLDQTAKTCPAGRHTMDPTWTECAYCKAEGVSSSSEPSDYRSPGARRETVVESAFAESGERKPTVVEGAGSSRIPTLSDPGIAAPTRSRKTQFYIQPTEATAGKGGTVPDRIVPVGTPNRRIVGILITYTWKSDGQIFPIREGRNLIGRDSEKCDIAIPEDDTLSAINSHITFRKNFVIGDNVSMSGTDVDGEPIEEQFRPLSNYATIRTGSTKWTFIAINPNQQAESEPAKP